MERIISDELTNEKNQISTVKLENIRLDEKTTNELFYEVLVKRENMELMFNEQITDAEHKRYINYFIPDESKDYSKAEEMWSYIERMCTTNATFFSAVSEGFVALVIKRYLEAEATHALIDIRNTLIDTHTGVDGAFFNSVNSQLFFVEAKFYKDGTSGARNVVKSLSKKAKNKYESFRNSTDVYVAEILNKESYDVRTVDVMRLDLTFIGFVIHENQITVNKTEYAEKIEKHVSEVYNIKQPDYKFILFHLKVDGKQKLIYDIITKSKERINE